MGGMLLFFVFQFKLLKLQGSTTNATRLQSMVHHLDLTTASAKFEIAMSNGLGGDAFTIKYIISPLNLTLGQGQTQNVAQFPLHYIPMHLQKCTKLVVFCHGNMRTQ